MWTRLALTILCSALVVAPLPAADEDVDRALAVVRSNAERGDVVSQFSLGSVLYYGAADLAQAVEWIRRAAAQGHPDAEYQLAQLYDFGFGVMADVAQALTWYRQAADHGHAGAQRQVGEFYRRGRGVEMDAAEAVRWYSEGAHGDDLRAQVQLAQAFFTGSGVARDYLSAYVWFAIAATQTPLLDNQKALIEFRNIAAARMTPEQEAEAVRRVRAWKPR